MTDSQEDKRLWKLKNPVYSFALKWIGQRFGKREESSKKEQDPNAQINTRWQSQEDKFLKIWNKLSHSLLKKLKLLKNSYV